MPHRVQLRQAGYFYQAIVVGVIVSGWRGRRCGCRCGRRFCWRRGGAGRLVVVEPQGFPIRWPLRRAVACAVAGDDKPIVGAGREAGYGVSGLIGYVSEGEPLQPVVAGGAVVGISEPADAVVIRPCCRTPGQVDFAGIGAVHCLYAGRRQWRQVVRLGLRYAHANDSS